ncbi:MAG: hypothetical protein WAW37_09375 [Syntrophobacteraceae bacterium]
MKSRLIAIVLAFLVVVFTVPALCEADTDEKDPFVLLNAERIGALYIGMPEAEVKKAVSCQSKRGKEILEHATGDYVAEWKYPDCGVTLKMGSERKGAPKTISSISIESPCTLKTKHGIRIGSTEEDVIEVYGKYQDADALLFTTRGEQFLAGSIYGGMIFRFKNGRVKGVFLGAAAE